MRAQTLRVSRDTVQEALADGGPSTLADCFRRLFKDRLASVTVPATSGAAAALAGGSSGDEAGKPKR